MYDTAALGALIRHLSNMLPLWQMPANSEVSLITVSENATFLAWDKQLNKKIIIRVHTSNYHSVEQILSELQWIRRLRAEKVVKTAAPLASTEGELVSCITQSDPHQYVVAFEFMPGSEPSVGDQLNKWFNALGETTAKLHQHAKNWQKPASFTRKIWDLEHCIGDKAYWGGWRNAVALTSQDETIISDAADLIADRLSSYGCGTDRFGLIHADLRLANLLVDEELTVIDFDDCGFSWFGYDFAAAISFHELDPSIVDLQRSWVQGYRNIAYFSDQEEQELSTFIMLRRIMLTSWIASHQHAHEAKELGGNFTRGTAEIALNYLNKFRI